VLSLAFLVARIAITSLGVAAGIALWQLRPGAVRLARLALALFTLEAFIRLASPIDLSAAPPGTRLPRALLLAAHNGAWLLYLQFSRRVRHAYALESQP